MQHCNGNLASDMPISSSPSTYPVIGWNTPLLLTGWNSCAARSEPHYLCPRTQRQGSV